MQSLTDPTQHLFWLGSRSLGIIAILLVSVSTGFGLALSVRVSGRPGAAARFKTLHESVALISLIAIVGHGLLLLGDSYLHPTLGQIAIPFTLPNRPLWTGAGIIAGWLAVVLGISYYARKKIGVALWRKLHRLTILVFALGIAHTIGAGTDGRAAWLIAMLGLAAVPVALLGGLRLTRPSGSKRTAKPRAGAVALRRP
ncbi:hypothetical protein BH10ACT11_BH10ACT11_06780 [soil metagenome]